MDERRRAPRQRTFKTGSITLPHGIVDCLIRNMSDTGMLLEFLEPPLIPDDFDLLVKPEMTRVQCHVARRKALKIGVEVSRYIVSVRTGT
jgi:hypothetical protein